MLLKLREKASRAYEQLSPGRVSPTEPLNPPFVSVDDIEDDLAIFGGQMRVVDRKGKHLRTPSVSILSGFAGGSSQPGSSASGGLSPKTNEISAFWDLGLGLPDVHPSLIQYLNQDAVRKIIKGEGKSTDDGAGAPKQPTPTPRSPKLTALGPSYVFPELGEDESRLTTSIAELFAENIEPNFASIPSGSATFKPQNQYISFADSSMEWSLTDPFPEALTQQKTAPTRTQPANPMRGLVPPLLPVLSPLDITSFPSMRHQQPRQPSNFNYTPFQPAAYVNSAGSEGMAGFFDSSSSTAFGTMGSGANSRDAGVIDIGLSNETGVDAGWVSFMRDCGIMDTEG